MATTRLIIRHSYSVGTRANRVLFGKKGGQLTAEGVVYAKKCGLKLKSAEIDFNLPVAVSELIRTQQTANEMGFKNLVIYPILNELKTARTATEIDSDVLNNIIPPESLNRAKEILANPPKESIWFSHGLVIAGLRKVENYSCDKWVPDFCESTLLEI